MTKPVCIIPARMGSSRFPGKPLVELLGLPLVLHVLERCRLYEDFAAIAVATCDAEIAEAVEARGGTAIMTSDRHDRATDRVEEAVGAGFADLPDGAPVVMVQGDELLVSPEMIAEVVHVQRRTGGDVVNLAARLVQSADHDNPNVVKVVADQAGRALYFSRAPIPSRARGDDVPMYQQTGIMAFTRSFLQRFGAMPQSPLEKIESVDMLRVLEAGHSIHLAFTDEPTLGVDVPGDKARGEAALRKNRHTGKYLETIA